MACEPGVRPPAGHALSSWHPHLSPQGNYSTHIFRIGKGGLTAKKTEEDLPAQELERVPITGSGEELPMVCRFAVGRWQSPSFFLSACYLPSRSVFAVPVVHVSRCHDQSLDSECWRAEEYTALVLRTEPWLFPETKAASCSLSPRVRHGTVCSQCPWDSLFVNNRDSRGTLVGGLQPLPMWCSGL